MAETWADIVSMLIAHRLRESGRISEKHAICFGVSVSGRKNEDDMTTIVLLSLLLMSHPKSSLTLSCTLSDTCNTLSWMDSFLKNLILIKFTKKGENYWTFLLLFFWKLESRTVSISFTFFKTRIQVPAGTCTGYHDYLCGLPERHGSFQFYYYYFFFVVPSKINKRVKSGDVLKIKIEKINKVSPQLLGLVVCPWVKAHNNIKQSNELGTCMVNKIVDAHFITLPMPKCFIVHGLIHRVKLSWQQNLNCRSYHNPRSVTGIISLINRLLLLLIIYLQFLMFSQKASRTFTVFIRALRPKTQVIVKLLFTHELNKF